MIKLVLHEHHGDREIEASPDNFSCVCREILQQREGLGWYVAYPPRDVPRFSWKKQITEVEKEIIEEYNYEKQEYNFAVMFLKLLHDKEIDPFWLLFLRHYFHNERISCFVNGVRIL